MDSGEDVVSGLCPAEGLGIRVVCVDERSDVAFESVGRAMDTTTDLLVGEHGEEPFDLIDPRGAGWDEVNAPAWTLDQPVADRLGLVSGVVVHDEVNVEFDGHIGLDLIEELGELAASMPRVAAAEHGARGYVEGSAQAGGAVARVIVAAVLDLTGPHRRHGMGAVDAARIWDFSFTHMTSARSGGLR